ncbi:MAG: glycosyltransferase family 4 protein [Bacteroidetes bacterium]|nr:glycosyltransferase family 4 protein [Bacteroidota bacterium]
MNPELVFICQYKMGGVQNYYQNMVKSSSFDGFRTRVIYTKRDGDTETPLPHLFNSTDEEHVFSYNEADGTYNNFKELKKLISDQPGIVFTNFPLELGCLHVYGSRKTVVFAVHDEWYIQNAIRYGFLIDVYICHNPGIFEELQRLMPDRRGDIYYLPYGIVPAPGVRQSNPSGKLKVLFIGRLHPLKGIFDIPLIDDQLKKAGVQIDWTIIGDGPAREEFLGQIGSRPNFNHLSPDTSEEVLQTAMQNDVFILPSRLEGMPVSLLEAMSAGLVPVIADFNKGIRSVVTADIGRVLPVGDVEAFATAIADLDKDRSMLDTMGRASRQKIESSFDAVRNTQAYYELFKKYQSLKSDKKSPLPVHYGTGRLDKPYIPGGLLKIFRHLKKGSV